MGAPVYYRKEPAWSPITGLQRQVRPMSNLLHGLTERIRPLTLEISNALPHAADAGPNIDKFCIRFDD